MMAKFARHNPIFTHLSGYCAKKILGKLCLSAASQVAFVKFGPCTHALLYGNRLATSLIRLPHYGDHVK